jgi:hypothetical protein
MVNRKVRKWLTIADPSEEESMGGKTIVASYDDFADALRAVRALEDAGFQHEDLGLLADNAELPTPPTHATDAKGGLIDTLVALGIPEQEAHDYAESVNRGGALVTARVPVDEAPRATAILQRHAKRVGAGTVPSSETEAALRSGIIRRESEIAHMTGGPLPSTMSGMTGSPEGAEESSDQREKPSRRDDGEATSPGERVNEAMDRAAAGDKPMHADDPDRYGGDDPLARRK